MPRRILVTGASKGIGKAIALKLAASGFNLALHYHHDRDGALDTQAQCAAFGGEYQLLHCDVSSPQECTEALTQDMEAHGAYYGIVSNAGITKDNAFPALAEEDWYKVINTDLNSFYNVIHPCIMPMIGLRQGGRIIAISSVSGLTGNRGQTNYAAAKAGLVGACKSLAIELGKRKITVNAIAPGLIETEMVQMNDIAMAEALKMIPLRRMGQASEVASLCNFLLSDEASYITRQVISINGGMI